MTWNTPIVNDHSSAEDIQPFDIRLGDNIEFVWKFTINYFAVQDKKLMKEQLMALAEMRIDQVTIAYKDGHYEVFYGKQIAAQKVETTTKQEPGKTEYIRLILTPRGDPNGAEAARAE